MKNYPSASTKLLGIIGNPIAHSKSPLMHNALFQKYQMNWCYIAFNVKPKYFSNVAIAIRSLGIQGVNVTLPYKIQILKYLDKIDPLAKKIGAINTIKNEKGNLIGRNTDAEGFLETLKNRNINLSQQKVVILGAGGAARAVAFSLLNKVKKITVINRSRENLKNLVDTLKQETPQHINGFLDDKKSRIKAEIENSTLLINTTPVGMYPHLEAIPIPAEYLHSDLTVYDIIYNPRLTVLLQTAKAKNCQIISGIEMLVYQGALAFEWWTGKKADIQYMKQIIEDNLKKSVKNN